MKLFRGRSMELIGKSTAFRMWDKELQAVGGIKLLGFRIERVGELVTAALGAAALFLLVAGVGLVTRGFDPLNSLLLFVGFGALFYSHWRRPIEEYRDSFLKDSEMPVAVEMFISGLEVGMSSENILFHLSKNLKGVVGRLFYMAQSDIDAGKSVSDALMLIAENSLSTYFQRFMTLVVAGREMGGGDTKHYLKHLLDEIEEVRGNERIERAGSINNTLFFPIFLGYFLPIIIIFSLPFIFSLGGLFRIF